MFYFGYNIHMKLQLGTIDRFNVRVQAVKKYIEFNSLNEVASSFNIHPITLRRWIKRYQQGGEENLKRKKNYRRHPKRLAHQIEEKIVLLKENNPVLTVSQAKEILNRQGIKISTGGIWNVWRRYNLSGQSEKLSGWETPEIKDGLKNARDYLEKGEIYRAARILNKLPHCPDKEVLKKIPDDLLSLSRQQEKLNLLYGEIPFPELMHKARLIREKAEKKNMFYTALRAGAIELNAMDWLGFHKEQLLLARKLKKKIEKIKNRNTCSPVRRFEILIAEAQSLARSGRIKEALLCIHRCENFCKHPVYSGFLGMIASFYSGIGFHRKARQWLEKSLKINKNKEYTYKILAANMAMAGEYNLAKRTLKKANKKISLDKTLGLIVNSLCAFGQGKIEDAVAFSNQSLASARKEAIPFHLWSSTLTLASCLASLGDGGKARNLIKRVFLQLRKFKIRRNDLLARIILGQKRLPKSATLMPDLRLATFLRQASKSLRIRDYRRAFNYATTQRLMGFFHRLIPLFPDSVNNLIAKGKTTGLPKELLRLPVFQKNIPVYRLNFLGPVHIYRNNVKLHRLTPMYTSFNIHLSFKKRIELNSLYRNFWPHAKNPQNSLSHLLFGVRKYLRLLPGTLFIKQGFLHFKGYITTDYQFYEETMIRAKALERAGEWEFAKKEYLLAFKLFRGEPFKKMYDPWSENMRRVVLNRLETEAVHFAKKCLEHRNKNDAKKVLEKVLKIIPDSEEIRKMVSECGK
ncbi:MAG TPA: hypothetical protein ENI34_08470 [candidate division WOR-3 bacterium]|uniref:Helix-turn-helix domain-containing protein n=1 Tax=candidate division WOR-3 bacterium TaxID=2052148 RepID=A0A9C9ENU9_UNCW3|nr:hypothetical protein [candidate division WOR-3 bacterium]